MIILNLTQHDATQQQITDRCRDLPAEKKITLRNLLTFTEYPEVDDIADRVAAITMLAEKYFEENKSSDQCAMIGGAPWLMSSLEKSLEMAGIAPCYAFSRREVVEETQEDGSVKKTAIFKHGGYVFV